MDSADQVILVLQLMLTIGPLAVYFLGIGLVSSRAYPCLVTERSDFVLLTLAFVPLICWPMVALVSGGRYALAAVLLTGLGALFVMLLPRSQNGWVIYNLNSQELRRTLRRACARRGWQMEYATPGEDDSEALVQPTGLRVTISNMPWLRTLTLRCPAQDERQAEARQAFLAALAGELRKEAMLPSPTGAGLVVIGAMLLGLPMWYFFHHISAIVDVVKRFFLA